MDRCDLKTVHLLKRNPNVKVEQTTGTLHYTFPMRTDTPPFDNNDVRLALKYAVDREALLQTVLKGFGQLGNDTIHGGAGNDAIDGGGKNDTIHGEAGDDILFGGLEKGGEVVVDLGDERLVFEIQAK